VCRQEYFQHVEQREIKEHVHEELKFMTHKETLHDLDRKTTIEDKVSNLLHCYLIFLNDLDAVRNLE